MVFPESECCRSKLSAFSWPEGASRSALAIAFEMIPLVPQPAKILSTLVPGIEAPDKRWLEES